MFVGIATCAGGAAKGFRQLANRRQIRVNQHELPFAAVGNADAGSVRHELRQLPLVYLIGRTIEAFAPAAPLAVAAGQRVARFDPLLHQGH